MGLRFRYAPDALSTRMYRGFGDMVEGWTKNLALLFPHALSLAAWRLLDILFGCCRCCFLTSHPFTPDPEDCALGDLGEAHRVIRFYSRVVAVEVSGR